MFISTRHFGDIEIGSDQIIDFDSGILGFETIKKYVLIVDQNDESAFKWLQSIDEPSLAFVVINPFYIKPDYELDIKDEVVRQLKIEKEQDVEPYCIVVVPEDITRMTVNLKAPVIINIKSKKGIQIVLENDEYLVKHYIMEQNKGEGNQNVGTDKKKRAVNSNRR